MLDHITDLPEDSPCKQQKNWLCVAHQLTKFQRVEKLHPMDSLGGRKPSGFSKRWLSCVLPDPRTAPSFSFCSCSSLPRS
jgi:hypothetical protein